jgi:hypothetical protein
MHEPLWEHDRKRVPNTTSFRKMLGKIIKLAPFRSLEFANEHCK